ncbi:universal stress protein [Zunongwangia sp. F363]|uniref:Universal stress protein n=1 Tax=Autumnicola tepida TaxID=3075595 RepID=A0ABU3C633_9FLAO|nr:universal stress protein [Zunongwangia sp. F363]MDT0641792.1 universal stress protein [Zunongwangia sp. F363]
MKKVLIALDYHPVAEEVARKGHELAKTLGASVCLLHAVTDVGYYGMEYPSFMGYNGYNIATEMNLASEMRTFAEDFMKSAVKHLNDDVVTYHITEGDTATGILSYAEEWNAGLIVMGTHSHSALEKLLVGTVASKVLERTKIPVYMVPVKKD